MQPLDWQYAVASFFLAVFAGGVALFLRKSHRRTPYAGRDREHDDG